MEGEETPEEILLMSTSESERQFKASPIVESMKFAWQSFKLMLELVKLNYRMMDIHKALCEEAFEFMISNNRIREAKKVFDILAAQVKSIQRAEQNTQDYESIPNKIDLARYDLVQKMLELRFEILSRGIKAKFFAECYKMYDDIGYLIRRLEQNAKEMKQMPNIGKFEQKYYIYLSELVWMAGFPLHHAIALYREYNILDMKKKAVHAEEKQVMISRLVMAILATPPQAGSQLSPTQLQKNFRYILGGETVLSDFDVEAHYNRRITELFMVSAMPSRDVIIKDIHRRNLMLFASPEIAKLFNFLEGEMHTPATFVKEASGLLAEIIKKMPELKKYEKSVLKTMITRIVEKIARYYKRIRLDKLKQFLPEGITDGDCEKMIVDCSRAGTISATIDNSNKVLVFHTNEVQTSSNRLRLTEFTKDLKKAVELIDKEMVAAELESAKNRLQEKILVSIDNEEEEIKKVKNAMQKERVVEAKIEKEKKRKIEMDGDPGEQQRLEKIKSLQRTDFRKEVLTKNIVELTEKKKIRLRDAILKRNPKIKFKGQKLSSIDIRSITLQELEALRDTLGKSEEKTLIEIIKKEVKNNDVFIRALREEESKMLLPEWKEQTTKLHELEVQVAEERKKEYQEATTTLSKIKESKDECAAKLKEQIMDKYNSRLISTKAALTAKYKEELITRANELAKLDEEEKKKKAAQEEELKKLQATITENKNQYQGTGDKYKGLSELPAGDGKITRSKKTREEMQKEREAAGSKETVEPKPIDKTQGKREEKKREPPKSKDDNKPGQGWRKKPDETKKEPPKEYEKTPTKEKTEPIIRKKDPPKGESSGATGHSWRKKAEKEPAKETKKEEATGWRKGKK